MAMNLTPIPATISSHQSDCHTICQRIGHALHGDCVSGNDVQLLCDGEHFVPAMLSAIRAARYTINVEFYRAHPGHLWRSFEEVLLDAAGRGVRVKAIFDSFGSRGMKHEDWQPICRAGVDLRLYNTTPLRSLSTCRDHRKVIVVDGTVGFVGGMSFDDTFFQNPDGPTWHELMARVRGPVVTALQHAFAASWEELTGEQLGGDSYFPHPTAFGDMRARIISSAPEQATATFLYHSALASAGKTVYLVNPFFAPGPMIIRELVSAPQRGVDVRLLLPGAYNRFRMLRLAMTGLYDQLLSSGVRIFEYQRAMLHAKALVVDSSWCTVGSLNLDSRSLRHNMELNLTTCDIDVARQLSSIFIADLDDAREVELAEWRRRGIRTRLRETMVKALRAWL